MKRSAALQGTLWCCSLLLICSGTWAPSQAAAKPKASQRAIPSAQVGAFELLAPDASAILSVQLSQLHKLRELFLESVPELRSTADLASLGLSTMLGWNPFEEAGWRASGFDPQATLVVHVEADGALLSSTQATVRSTVRRSRLWRGRIVIPAVDPAQAKSTLSKIRFGTRVQLDAQSDSSFGALLGLDRPSDQRIRKKLLANLRKAGVFLVAKPKGTEAIVLIAQRGNHIVVDVVLAYGSATSQRPWGRHHRDLARLISQKRKSRKAGKTSNTMRAAKALDAAPLGLWLEPSGIAAMLLAVEFERLTHDAKGKVSASCRPFVALGHKSQFSALSLRGAVDTKRVSLDLRWQLRKRSTLPSLLTTSDAPLLAKANRAFHAQLRLDKPGRLREQVRPFIMQTWDHLWREAARCHPLTKPLVMTFAWPELAGLFLDELAALHPQANLLLGSLGAITFATEGEGSGQALLAEAWLRDPGQTIARDWLQALFGLARTKSSVSRWGRGPMQPYMLAKDGGAIIGSNLVGPAQPGSPSRAPTKSAEAPGNSAILVLQGRPSALAQGLGRHTILALLQAWQKLSGKITVESDSMRFTIDLMKD